MNKTTNVFLEIRPIEEFYIPIVDIRICRTQVCKSKIKVQSLLLDD
jgi:hypothetical protein